MSVDPILSARGVHKTYRTGSVEVAALRGIDLHIETGTFVALQGRSGSGKTTLLNCLGGLDQPTSGSIEVLGKNIAQLNDAELTRWRREQALRRTWQRRPDLLLTAELDEADRLFLMTLALESVSH